MADEVKTYNLTLEDGSVVKGTAEEIVQTVGKMKSDTAAALKQEREARVNLESQVADLSRRIQPPKVPGAFDNDQFYTDLNRAPADAVVNAWEHKAGMSASDLKQLSKDVFEIKQNMIGAQFMQKHGHEFDPEKYRDVLIGKTADLINQGYPLDLRTAEVALRELVDEGRVKLLEPKSDEPVKEEPPPRLDGGGDQMPADEEAKLNSLNMDELEKVMRDKGFLK